MKQACWPVKTMAPCAAVQPRAPSQARKISAAWSGSTARAAVSFPAPARLMLPAYTMSAALPVKIWARWSAAAIPAISMWRPTRIPPPTSAALPDFPAEPSGAAATPARWGISMWATTWAASPGCSPAKFPSAPTPALSRGARMWAALPVSLSPIPVLLTAPPPPSSLPTVCPPCSTSWTALPARSMIWSAAEQRMRRSSTMHSPPSRTVPTLPAVRDIRIFATCPMRFISTLPPSVTVWTLCNPTQIGSVTTQATHCRRRWISRTPCSTSWRPWPSRQTAV